MMIRVAGWALFAWGCLACGVMAYYGAFIFGNPLFVHGEAALGFTMGVVYGWPSWIGLPAIAVTHARRLRRREWLVWQLPVLAALCLFVAMARIAD